MLTDVIQLLQDRCTMPVDRVGDLAKMRNDFVIAMPKIASGQNRGRMDRHGFNHDHRSASDRAFLIVTSMPFAR